MVPRRWERTAAPNFFDILGIRPSEYNVLAALLEVIQLNGDARAICVWACVPLQFDRECFWIIWEIDHHNVGFIVTIFAVISVAAVDFVLWFATIIVGRVITC